MMSTKNAAVEKCRMIENRLLENVEVLNDIRNLLY